jgi:creatinine amidohydrolase/Fe(II)-dependent formamide hydrolase-like protein
MSMKRALVILAVVGSVGALTSHAQSQTPRVLQLEELRWPQIDALDRERTLFILPIGMVEEHGPHLPVGADTFGVLFEARGAARRVSQALPQWTLVMMPALNYGETGANELGNRPVHPGTYGVRHTTLRSLVADIGAQVAQNGFRWIFVLSGHGAPTHAVAVNEACDFVSETFAVTMVHVSALFRADAAIQTQGESIAARHFSAGERSSFGMDVHAGVGETSAMLALRPDLVSRTYKKLPNLAGRTVEELQAIATAPGWQGYVSSPANATAAYGRAVEAWWVNGLSDLIRRAALGENLVKAPRFGDRLDPARRQVVDRALENERALDVKLEEWLARRRQR